MAITRLTPTDDSGGGTDGTIINLAWLGTLYDSIENAYGVNTTWTPTIGGSTSQSGQAYSVQVGSVRRVDKLVHLEGRIILSTVGTITGNVQIKGLPVAAKTLTNNGSALVIGRFGQLATSVSWLGGWLDSAGTAITLQMVPAAGATGSSNLAQADLAASFDIHFAIDYISA